MKYTVSRQPLVEAVDLAIINKNVSKLFQKSGIVQITATDGLLKLNVESTAIETEVILQGQPDGDDYAISFVDCTQFKSLLNTLSSETVTFEFVDGGIILYSNKSKFRLPNVINVNSFSLVPPDFESETVRNKVSVEISGWKSLQNKQLYALSSVYTSHAIYTKAWVGEDGRVLVCNYDDGLFTMSDRVTLGENCLLSDTIINLIASMPSDVEIYTNGNRSYFIVINRDTFRYVTKFSPFYEDDKLTYHADVIMDKFSEGEGKIVVSKEQILKFLSQVSIVSSGADAENIIMQYADNMVHFKNVNLDCTVDSSTTEPVNNFDIKLNTKLIYTSLSHFDDNDITFSVIKNEDTAVGIVISGDNTDVLLSGID